MRKFLLAMTMLVMAILMGGLSAPAHAGVQGSGQWELEVDRHTRNIAAEAARFEEFYTANSAAIDAEITCPVQTSTYMECDIRLFLIDKNGGPAHDCSIKRVKFQKPTQGGGSGKVGSVPAPVCYPSSSVPWPPPSLNAFQPGELDNVNREEWYYQCYEFAKLLAAQEATTMACGGAYNGDNGSRSCYATDSAGHPTAGAFGHCDNTYVVRPTYDDSGWVWVCTQGLDYRKFNDYGDDTGLSPSGGQAGVEFGTGVHAHWCHEEYRGSSGGGGD